MTGQAHIVPSGMILAKFIKERAQVEELSTHVEVTFEPLDAATILFMAERLLERWPDAEQSA